MTADARWVGSSVKRSEDLRFLTGRGRYLDDIRLPGLLHLALVRSPHAHARIVRIDATEARRRTGVRAVLAAADLPELATAVVPALVPTACFRPYAYPVLPADRVRHVGEAVVVVVAEDPYLAADALDGVAVE